MVLRAVRAKGKVFAQTLYKFTQYSNAARYPGTRRSMMKSAGKSDLWRVTCEN